MGRITEEARRVVEEQRLGFWATVCADGSPNLSPKGTTRVFDDDHLFFAEICSPETIANVRAGSIVEVNVVDPLLRKGFRFKGPAEAHEPPSPTFAAALERLDDVGPELVSRIRAVVLLRVDSLAPLVSPAYDGSSEDEVLAPHAARFARLLAKRGRS